MHRYWQYTQDSLRFDPLTRKFEAVTGEAYADWVAREIVAPSIFEAIMAPSGLMKPIQCA